MKNLYVVFFSLIISVAAAQDGEFHLDQVYKISKNGTIDLSSSDANVFITGSLRPDAHVKIDRKVTVKGLSTSRSEFSVEVTPTDDGLRIREHQNSFNSGFVSYYKEDYRIEIEAPEGVSLTIRGDDGDYFIKNINGAISMSMDDADAEFTDCKGSQFSFRIDDGDIRMDKAKGSLEVDADDADIEIYHAAFTSIRADVDDGDLIIETSLANNGEYYFQAQDGLVSLDITSGGGEFDIRHDDGHVSSQGNFRTVYDSDDHKKLTLANGSAKVSMRADDARVKLNSRN